MGLNFSGLFNLFKRNLSEGEGTIQTGFGNGTQSFATSGRSYAASVLNIPAAWTDLGEVSGEIAEGQTVLLIYSGMYNIAAGGGYMAFRFTRDGADLSNGGILHDSADDAHIVNLHFSEIATVSKSVTYKIQANSQGGVNDDFHENYFSVIVI